MKNLLVFLANDNLNYLDMLNSLNIGKLFVIVYSTNIITLNINKTKYINIINKNDKNILIKNDINIIVINTILNVKINSIDITQLINDYNYVKKIYLFSNISINTPNKYLIYYNTCILYFIHIQ